MRALVLSDIHGNLQALEAVLGAVPAHDTVWLLGDIVGYGANPNEVIERVRELGSIFVRGNHDRACSGLMPLSDFNPVAAQAVEWTRRALTPENLEWLRGLPRGPIPAAGGVSCAHGSPKDEDTYIVSTEDAIRASDFGSADRARITFFGHTHLQGGFGRGDEWYVLRPECVTVDDRDECTLLLSRGASYLLNPGSVGQPRDGDWRAAFALYDEAASAVTYYRVPYDIEEAQRRILEAGLPHRLATRLRSGT